jgi:hypothetical protein
MMFRAVLARGRKALMEAWLYGIPFVILVVAASVGGMLLIHRFTPLAFLKNHNEVAGFIYAVVGVIYAVIMAFAVTFVWEQHKAAEARVEQEANELGDLFRDAAAFPPEDQQILQAAIRAYVQAVRESEWQAMTKGKQSPEAWRAYNDLWQAYAAFIPATAQQNIWYGETIGDLNDAGDARRLRLLSNHATVPGILWVVMVAGGVITIGFGYFFGTENRLAHILMMVAVSGAISLNLFVIYALDRPFQGLAPVSPEAFDQLVEIFDNWSAL